MATHFAIAGACEAVVRLLRWRYDPNVLGTGAEFQVYAAEDFRSPMEAGVSLFVYRVYHDATRRTLPGRLANGSTRQRDQLAVDVHFLLTAWGSQASRQHEIAGWMVRVMEDNPILPATLLNDYRQDVFSPDETVELSTGQLTVDDMFHIWDVMRMDHAYELSIPYVARGITIESLLTARPGVLVQQREADFGSLGPALDLGSNGRGVMP